MSEGYRYPGTKPFETEDQQLFFGRDAEIAKLSQVITLERITVLFGKSGIGKTSLIKAGIIPKLEKEEEHVPVYLRLGGYIDKGTDSLKNAFLKNFPRLNGGRPSKFERLIAPSDSLLYHFKRIQFEKAGNLHFIVIFDQFEEFFTHPEEDAQEFLRELSEVMNVSLNQEMRRNLREVMQRNSRLFTEEELEVIYDPIKIRAVFAIRTDRLNLLNKLAGFFPDILRNNYELEALNNEQARLAIQEPGMKDGGFLSPYMEFEEVALDYIIKFLSDDGRQNIESFQLQIICEYAEQKAIEFKEIFLKNQNRLLEKITLKKTELGDIRKVYENYYMNKIQSLPAEQQRTARVLLEEGLIFEKEERRIPLYEGQIFEDFDVSAGLLKSLVDLRLIRREKYTSGFYYELSHDTFVRPILEAKQRRLNAERVEKAIKEREEKSKREELAREFSEARKLSDYEEEKLRLTRRIVQRKTAMYYWKNILKKNRSLVERRLILFAAILLLFLGSAVYFIYQGIRNSGSRAKIEVIQEKLNAINKEMDEVIHQIDTSSGVEPALKKRSNDLIEQYKNLEKDAQ